MRFLSIEHALPSQKVTNDDIIERTLAASSAHLSRDELATMEELLRACFTAAGTSVRFHRTDEETPAGLTVAAADRALEAAGVDPLEVDLLLYASIGRGVVEPASATTFQDLLGLRNATAFDVLDACAGWLRALHVADAFLRSGTYRTIMIVNAEFSGRDAYRYELRSLEEFAHWHPTSTIGEAAAATIVTAGGAEFEADFRTYGQHRDLCFVPLPGFAGYFATPDAADSQPLRFVSYGLSLMEVGTRKLVEHHQALPRFRDYQPDVVFTHSASDGASRHVMRACGLDENRCRLDHHNHANTVSAALPVAMSDALRTGELADGDRVLLMVASAGVTTALARFTYGR